MSKFSALLQEYLQHSDLRAVDISFAMQLSKSYLSRVLNGKLLPKKESFVTEIATLLQLTAQERETLYAAYAAEKTGLPYDKLQETVYRIFHIPHHIPPAERDELPPLQNGDVFMDETAINDAIRRMLSAAEGTVRILLRHQDEAVYRVILQQLIASRLSCSWILPMQTGEGAAQAFEDLLDVALLLPVLLNADVTVRTCAAAAAAGNGTDFFPYCVITQRGVLLITADHTQAMYLDFPQVTALHAEKFDALFEHAEPLCTVFDDYRAILLNYASQVTELETIPISRMYVLARRPCVVFSVSQSAIMEHLNLDGDKNQMAQAYRGFLDMLSGSRTGKVEEHIFLAEDGIREFLCDEEFYEFNKCISLPISREIRHACFRKMLGSIARNKVFDYNVTSASPLDAASNCTVNTWPDGRIILFYDFEDSYRIVIMNGPSLAQAMIGYFQHLRECGMTVSGKEVLCLMQEKYAQFGA